MILVRRLFVAAVIASAGIAVAALPANAAIAVRMEATKVPQGKWAYAIGTTEPGQKIVFVQRWNGSRWYDITGAAVRSDGSFRAALKPKDSGIYTFRVRSKSGSVLSKTFYLNVLPVRPPVPVYFSMVTGHDSFVSKDFKVPATWRLGFSAGNFRGYICVFDLYADYADGRSAHLVHTTADALGDGGHAIIRNAAGTMRIIVESDCDTWTVQIQGV